MVSSKIKVFTLFLGVQLSAGLATFAQQTQTTTAPTQTAPVPSGKIAGKVIDKNTGEALIGVIVRIPSLNKGSQTDLDGKFVLKAPVGTYDIEVKYISYATQTVKDVVVSQGQVTDLNFTMEEEAKETKEVVITGKVEKESSNFILIERKNAAQVSDGISSESFKKTPDRSTADVLKRVTGASIQEGKFAIIRGMNDRYNAGYLNDAPLPSTEADRKAFSFDVIPANLIDNIQIMKAGTPDVTGDFGGGVIQIRTKAIPTTFTQSLNIGGQYNSLATFKENTTFKRYSANSLGLVNSERKLPDVPSFITETGLPDPSEYSNLVTQTKKFNNDWTLEKFKAMPNMRFSYSLGFPTKFLGKDLGVIAAITYANTRNFTQAAIKTFKADNSNMLERDYTDKAYKQNVTSGAILNLSYKLGNNHTIGLRNFYNINSDLSSIFRSGVTGLSDNPFYVKSESNLMTYGRLMSNQVYGEHGIGTNPFIIKWYVNNSSIVRLTPDYKIANYSASFDTPNSFEFPKSDLFKTGTGKFFSDMKENLTNGEVNVKKAFKLGIVKSEAKIGVFAQTRKREFLSRNFIYNSDLPSLAVDPAIDLDAKNVKENGGVFLVEKTGITDTYKGGSNLLATYAMIDHKFLRFRTVYGVRIEHFSQEIKSYDYLGVENLKSDFKTTTNILPSLNLSYSLNEKSNFRAAFYKTVNRPELREIASFAFYRFDVDSDQQGLPTLQSASINNIDLRYELFPTAGQVLSVGAFYKNVKNPIENKLDITQVTRTFTYSNEKSAIISGLEFEFRKNLDFISKAMFFKSTTVYANFTLINSKVTFIKAEESYNRPLQGQSPYIVNGGITYENPENGWGVSAAVNRAGKRVAFVGAKKELSNYNADIYEMPRTVLDIQLSKNIGKFNLKGTLGDILAQDLVFLQSGDSPAGATESTYRNELFRYKMPWTFTLAAGLQF